MVQSSSYLLLLFCLLLCLLSLFILSPHLHLPMQIHLSEVCVSLYERYAYSGCITQLLRYQY